MAEEGGHLVGWGEAFLLWDVKNEDVGFLWVAVRDDARRRGLGGGLYRLGEEHRVEAGARRLQTFLLENEKGRRFVRIRGFHESRTDRCLTLDPREVDLSGLAPLEAAKGEEGFRLVRLRDVRDRPEALYRLYCETHADVPSDHEHEETYEDWLRTTFDYPDLDPDVGAVVLAGVDPAALAWVLVDHEGARGAHLMTGTRRDFRRRGLARLAKLATIRWAAESGVATLVTENDTTNADMLALNEHLGYRPTATLRHFAKDVE